MIQNYMLLPIYEHKEQQFRFRSECQTGEDFHTFRVPVYMLPSFFFKREKRVQSIGYFEVYDLNDNLVVRIPADDVNLHQVSSPEFDGFGYVSKRIENSLSIFDDPAMGDRPYNNYLLPCGKYYYKLSEPDRIKCYYSEIFEVVDNKTSVDTDFNEMVLNGDFIDGLINWFVYGSWAVVAGKAVYSGGSAGPLMSQIIGTDNLMGNHFYKFEFTITNYNNSGDNTRYIRAGTNYTDWLNSIVIRGNGTYTFYFTAASRIYFHWFNGDVTFEVDGISLQKIIGQTEHVSMMLSKDCKFPNSIDKNNWNYFNYYLLNARILKPEYGEVLKEEENGDFEKVSSFARPFKKHSIQPTLMPECFADAMAQLNTFDIVEIFDDFKGDLFRLNSTERLTKFRSIQSFETKFDWQPNDCFMLADISFEENLALFDKCCDDDEQICDCPNDDHTIIIKAVFEDGFFTITRDEDSPGTATDEELKCSMITLFFLKKLRSEFTTCGGIFGVATNTGISVSYADFLANGIDFYANDPDYIYSFSIVATQVGCEDDIASQDDCAGCFPFDTDIEFEGADVDNKHIVPVTPIPTGITCKLMVYCSDNVIADCDDIDINDYDQFGVDKTAEQFNEDGFTFPVATCPFFCIMVQYVGCATDYSNRL